MVSKVCLLFVKPNWSGFISVGRTPRRYLARSFIYTLMSVLCNEIGQKFAGVLGSIPRFGKVITWAANISGGKEA